MTLDLLDGRHEELVAALPSLSSKLAAVRLLVHLRDLPSLQESPHTLFYHVDTARRLCGLILEPSSISGHIGFLRDLLETLSTYRAGPAAHRVQSLQPALGRLRLLLAAELAVRDQWPDVHTVFPDVTPPAESQPDLASFLSALAEHPEATGLQWPFHLRNPATSVSKGSVLTVLVDGPSVPEAYREAYLTLLSANVMVHKRRGEEPHVVRSRDDRGEDLPLGDDLKDLVREATGHALRLLGPHIARRAERHRFEIEISLRRPDPVTTVQGRSILLPLALVLAEQLSEQLNLPFAFLSNRSIVWTGDIDDHGTLATVGDVGLKAARVASSRSSGFTFPAIDQETLERDSRYLPSHPPFSRQVVTALTDLTVESHLVRIPSRSLTSRMALVAKHRARPLGMAGVGVVVASVLALSFLVWNLAAWIDTSPASVRVTKDGNTIEVLNSRDRRMKSLAIPARTSAKPSLGDADGDGKMEVFVGTAAADSCPGTLFCLNMDGTERWRFAGGFPDGAAKPFPLDNTFSFVSARAHDLNHDDKMEIIAVFNHRPYYAGQIAVLDPVGRMLGAFWNPGQISEQVNSSFPTMEFLDLDHDGLDEILACVNNNSCDRAAVVILDPRSLRGLGYIQGDSLRPAEWQSYVLFPRFKSITEAMGVRRFEAGDLTIGHWGGQRVFSVGLRAILPDVGRVVLMQYFLNFDLELVHTYVCDSFVAWAQRAHYDAFSNAKPSSEEFRREMHRIEVVPGPHRLLIPE